MTKLGQVVLTKFGLATITKIQVTDIRVEFFEQTQSITDFRESDLKPIAKEQKFTEEELKQISDELYEICDSVHSSCDSCCPVFSIYNRVPDTSHDYKVNCGCDCFKEGTAMMNFIIEHLNK